MNIVITGSSKGIGKTIAERFASADNNLFLCARNREELEATAVDLETRFPASKISFMAVDLSIESEVQRFAEYCLAAGTPEVLINNTGQYIPGNIADKPDGNLEQMMHTNLFSAYHLTRKVLPKMKESGKGHIFNICSIASLNAYEGGGSYSISKFALDGFSKNLRFELKTSGIKVTSVYPGAVMTDSWGDFDNSNRRIMEATDIAEMIYASTRLSPQAVVEEIVIRPQLGDL